MNPIRLTYDSWILLVKEVSNLWNKGKVGKGSSWLDHTLHYVCIVNILGNVLGVSPKKRTQISLKIEEGFLVCFFFENSLPEVSVGIFGSWLYCQFEEKERENFI